MSISNNTTYSKAVFLATTALMTTITVSAYNTSNYLSTSSYDMFINYSIEKQSTIDSSNIKNDIEMLKLLEIDELNNEIKSKFGTNITDTWIPADGFLDKCCLFIEVNNQDKLIQSSENFELDLYLALEDKINKSDFFDMIALI